MSDVEWVALWIGLLSSVVGVALSIVAILFAWAVERGSRDVNNKTIQSLQKIESEVERLSSDTQNLIKGAWDRMLPGSDPQTSDRDREAGQIAAGLAAEVRQGFGGPRTPGDAEEVKAAIEDLRRVVESQLQAAGDNPRPGNQIEVFRRQLEELTPPAVELTRILLDNGHLTQAEYRRLRRNQAVGGLLAELRNKGFLVPLIGHGDDESAPPVYWFRPGMKRYLPAALTLVNGQDRETREQLARIVQENLDSSTQN
jgi:hypothetical protein